MKKRKRKRPWKTYNTSSKSVATINCAFYAFKWIHFLAGVDSPALHPTVIALKEGAVRLASQPIVNREKSLEAHHLKLRAAETNLKDLLQLRNLVMFILAFSGFLRSSELCVIRSRDVQFNEGYVKISIEKSKTNQLREGRSVVIAESSSITCPCSLLKLYIICLRPRFLKIQTSIFLEPFQLQAIRSA